MSQDLLLPTRGARAEGARPEASSTWTVQPAAPTFGPAQQGSRPRRADTVAGVLRGLRRQLPLVVGGLALGLAGGVAAVRVMTPLYQPTASIQMESREDAVPQLFRNLEPNSAVATGVEVLRSRALAQQVADEVQFGFQVLAPRVPRASIFRTVRVDPTADTATYELRRANGASFDVFTGKPARRVARAMPGERTRVPNAAFELGAAPGLPDFIRVRIEPAQAAVDGLQKTLTAERANRDANVINLAFRTRDPILGRDVLNSLAAQFVTRRQSAQTTDARTTATFLGAQIDTLSRELALSEDQLRRFQERARVVNPAVEGSTQVSKLADLQARRQETDAERRALEGLLADIGQQASRQPAGAPSVYRRVLGFPALLKNQLASTYLASLTEIEQQRAALLARRTADDPDVLLLTRRATDIEGQLRGTAESYLQALTQEVASMDGQLAQAGQRLNTIPGAEIELARLQRQPKVMTDMLALLQTRRKEAQIAAARQDATVQVLDSAVVESEPVWPRPLVFVPAAAMLGLVAGAGAALVRERRDRVLRSREDVSDVTRAPVLGVVPNFFAAAAIARGTRDGRARRLPRGLGRRGRAPAAVPTTLPVVDAYARLNMTLAPAVSGTRPQSFVVTSSLPRDGKTTTAINLAVALATRGTRVLLVDADLRRGEIGRRLDVYGVGFGDVLRGLVAPHMAVSTVAVGRDRMLSLIPAGVRSDDTAMLLDPERLGAVHAALLRDFDTIIYDTPPINLVADAAALSVVVGHTLVVARAGVTTADALTNAIDQLSAASDTVDGVVLNDVHPSQDPLYTGMAQYLPQYLPEPAGR